LGTSKENVEKEVRVQVSRGRTRRIDTQGGGGGEEEKKKKKRFRNG
jgi:hypothetical protein